MKLFLVLALPLYILDQVTKALITARFSEPSYLSGDYIPVIPGFFNLVRVHNTGMAFGIGNGTGYANYLFLLIAAAAITFIIVLWRRQAFPNFVSRIAAVLLLAGILGNVTDRLFRGYVVDFLDFNLGFMRWPSFNVADSCICIAAALLFIGSFLPQTEESKRLPSL